MNTVLLTESDSGAAIIAQASDPATVILAYEIPPASTGLGTGLVVYGETPSGAIDGVNATFQSLHDFVPESVAVYLNGVRQRLVDDYQTSGTQTVVLSVSPSVGEKVLFDYLRSD